MSNFLLCSIICRTCSAHASSLHCSYCRWSLRYCAQFGRGKKPRSKWLVRRACKTGNWLRGRPSCPHKELSLRGYVRSRAGKDDKVAPQHGGVARSRKGRTAAGFRAAAVSSAERASIRSIVYCESLAVDRTRSGVAGGRSVEIESLETTMLRAGGAEKVVDFAARFSQRFFAGLRMADIAFRASIITQILYLFRLLFQALSEHIGAGRACSHHRSRPRFSPAFFVPAHQKDREFHSHVHAIPSAQTQHHGSPPSS